jgi:hypothetical protein
VSSIEEAISQTEDSVTLFCAWRSRRRDDEGAGPYAVAKIDTTDEVADFLREAAQATLRDVADSTRLSYTPDAELDEGEAFVLDNEDDLDELADFRALIDAAASLERIDPADLPRRRVQLYGLAVGDREPRTGFIRKASPVKTATKGGIFARGLPRLAAVEEPIFELAGVFDFVVADGWAAVLQQRAYELLLKESPAMQTRVNAWVDAIATALPLSTGSEQALRTAASRDSRLWRRLRAIHQRGHLARVGIDQVEAYARHLGLDTDELIVDGQLEFEADDRFTIVKLLNEDLNSGELTGERFEAHRKGPLE